MESGKSGYTVTRRRVPKEFEEVAEWSRKKKEWRMCNSMMMLTYSDHHLNKRKLKKFFRETISDEYEITFLRIAHENGKNGEHPHTHMLVKFDRAYDCRNERKWDVPWIEGKEKHPNIQFICSKSHWNRCLTYLGKEDADNHDLVDKRMINDIFECETLEDALSLCTKPSEIIPYKVGWECKPPPEIPQRIRDRRVIENLYEWQEVVLNVIIPMKKTRGRCFHWIYDKKGNKGKTRLLKHLWSTMRGKFMFFKHLGSMRDMLMNVQNYQKLGVWYPEFVILDLQRQYEEKHHLYQCMESLIDGLDIGSKYSGGIIDMGTDDSNMIVFANFKPDFSAMSIDRYRLYEINDDLQLIKKKFFMDEDKNVVKQGVKIITSNMGPPPHEAGQ